MTTTDMQTKFSNVSCSQCGRDFGPGNSGFSDCRSHAFHDWLYREGCLLDTPTKEQCVDAQQRAFEAALASRPDAQADERGATPRYVEWLHLRQHGQWIDGVPEWARDHDGRMNDMTAAIAVIEELARVVAPQAGALSPGIPIELRDVAAVLEEGGGFWRPCSGCHETNEGCETGHYPYSKILKCVLGAGCSECGGIGAVWDDTDYDAMAAAGDADEIARESAAPSPDREQVGEAERMPPYDGLLSEFVDEVARLCNDAPGSRNAVYGALQSCNAVVVPVDVSPSRECGAGKIVCGCTFDAWRQNPYTKTLEESIKNDYLPKAASAPTLGGGDRRHCHICNSERKGSACWKCGSETTIPANGWEYPALPPIDRIRELAKEIGYAIGVHGSLERDLDLIAAPWSADAAKLNYSEVMHYIAGGLGARLIETEIKPLGRRACTIQMDGYYKPIDLSVMPFKVGMDLKGFAPADEDDPQPQAAEPEGR